MTVKELRKQLKKFRPNDEITVKGCRPDKDVVIEIEHLYPEYVDVKNVVCNGKISDGDRIVIVIA